MTLTDYKFSYIKRLDDGTTEAKVRFFEGNITTELELDMDLDVVDSGALVPVTRYRRSPIRLREETFRWRERLSDDDVRDLMDVELAEDTTRTPIDEQKVGVTRR